MERDKKRRGKPAHNSSSLIDTLEGVVDDSSSPYSMEMIYQSPDMFKCAFNAIHSCNQRTVCILFERSYMIIFCNDHCDKLVLHVLFSGSNMIKYQCKKRTVISFNSAELKGLLGIIKKGFGKIRLFINEDDNYSKMSINLVEKEAESIDGYEVPINVVKAPDKFLKFLDYEYDVSFKVDAKLMKKRLTMYKSTHDLCQIIYNGSIEFKYTKSTENRKGYLTKYPNDRKIELKRLKNVDEVTCLFILEDFVDAFKCLVSPICYVTLSNSNGLCLTFYMDPIDPSKLITPYPFDDKIYEGDLKNTIIFKIYYNT